MSQGLGKRVIGRFGRLVDRACETMSERLERRAMARWTSAPIADRPLGSAEEYRRLWQQGKRERNPDVDAYEQSAGEAIDPEWFHHLALLTQVSIKASPVCYYHGRLLYSALAGYARRHANESLTVIETGTARGFATLCMARALSDTGAGGKILSFDVLPHDVPIFWNSIRDAEGPTTRAELLGDYRDLLERYVVFCQGNSRVALGHMAFPRVHFAFLDSVHTYDHVMAEFGAIRGRQLPGDLLFFDDYTKGAYPGVVKAADEICRAEGYAGTVVEGGPNRTYLIAEKR